MLCKAFHCTKAIESNVFFPNILVFNNVFGRVGLFVCLCGDVAFVCLLLEPFSVLYCISTALPSGIVP